MSMGKQRRTKEEAGAAGAGKRNESVREEKRMM